MKSGLASSLWPLFSLFTGFSRSKKWSLSLRVWHMLFFIQLFVQGFLEGDTNTPYSPYSSLNYIGFGSKRQHKNWGPVFSVVLGKGIFLWCICFHAWYSAISILTTHDTSIPMFFLLSMDSTWISIKKHIHSTFQDGFWSALTIYSPWYVFFLSHPDDRYRLRPSIQSLYNRFFWSSE